MNTQLKIAVCGNQDVVPVIRDSLRSIDGIDLTDNVGDADIIYWVYGRGPSVKKYFHLWIRKYPVIINHWIGTDVLDEERKRQQHGFHRIPDLIQDSVFRWKRNKGGLLNLAGAPWLVKELSLLNISASYLPITTIDPKNLAPVHEHQEKEIDFLSYVPYNRFDFYGGDKIMELARRWKEYTFLIVCADLTDIPPEFKEKKPGNVIFSPCVDRAKMCEFYQKSKFFIRYTRHDSESLSVFEALYYNLQVLWTYDFPCTIRIRTLDELSESVPTLVTSWQPNYEGHAFIMEKFSLERWKTNFLAIIQHQLRGRWGPALNPSEPLITS